MLLLFAPLGEDKPLGLRNYRSLLRMLEALGGADPDGELTEEELARLGMAREEAGLILRRLSREDLLERYLDTLARLGITAVTRISPEYPARLRETLGDGAPMLLCCTGDLSLFGTECVALEGSRKLREPGQKFSAALGQAAAQQGLTLVSGGAAGADTLGMEAALAAGGSGIAFLADSLQDRLTQHPGEIAEGRLLLVSEGGFDLPFSIPRAYSRNRLIHAMGQKVFAAQSDYGAGGTWQGVTENLKHGWSPVFMFDGEPEDPGTRGLLERGCAPVSMEGLADLRGRNNRQVSLFE